MADPKYADLPGIAYDQPDVFETSDLPEADQPIPEDEEVSEHIERIHLSSSDAFNKFKGKRMDPSRADFSDKIGRRKQSGYDVTSMEYELLGTGTGEPETVMQKFQRLQIEVQELADEVQKAKANEKKESKADDVTLVGLDKQLNSLKSQLNNVVGSEVIASIAQPQDATHKKLLMQLDTFKQQSSGAANAKSSTKAPKQSGDGQITYELLYRPELSKFGETAKVADLEHRLQKLESMLGKDSIQISVLSSDTQQKSVLKSLSVINSKLNLLEPSHLDQIDGRLTALSLRLGQLIEKRELVHGNEDMQKIQESYELLKKVEIMSSELPNILNRLVTLKNLHEQTLQFSKVLSQLDSSQQQVIAGINNNKDVLTEAQQGFNTNMEIIKSNIQSLEKRMANLK